MNIRCRNKTKAYWRIHINEVRGKDRLRELIEKDPTIKDPDKFMEALWKEFDRLSKLPKHVDENGMICVGDKTYD
jgi:hypothetical protein